MEMVHPLDGTTFSDQTGANVLSRFKFDQKVRLFCAVSLQSERMLIVLLLLLFFRLPTSFSWSSDLLQFSPRLDNDELPPLRLHLSCGNFRSSSPTGSFLPDIFFSFAEDVR